MIDYAKPNLRPFRQTWHVKRAKYVRWIVLAAALIAASVIWRARWIAW